MCIRDRPKAVKDPLRVVKGKDLTEDTVLAKKGVENSNKMPGGTTYPVSYTHLDVYKRQFLYFIKPVSG